MSPLTLECNIACGLLILTMHYLLLIKGPYIITTKVNESEWSKHQNPQNQCV